MCIRTIRRSIFMIVVPMVVSALVIGIAEMGDVRALKRIGLNRGDNVMLVSENRPEWCIADLAIMAAGCVTVPTYTTNTTRDHTHILTNSGARAVIDRIDPVGRNCEVVIRRR